MLFMAQDGRNILPSSLIHGVCGKAFASIFPSSFPRAVSSSRLKLSNEAHSNSLLRPPAATFGTPCSRVTHLPNLESNSFWLAGTSWWWGRRQTSFIETSEANFNRRWMYSETGFRGCTVEKFKLNHRILFLSLFFKKKSRLKNIFKLQIH